MRGISKITGEKTLLLSLSQDSAYWMSKYIPSFSDWVLGESSCVLQHLPPSEEIMKERKTLFVHLWYIWGVGIKYRKQPFFPYSLILCIYCCPWPYWMHTNNTRQLFSFSHSFPIQHWFTSPCIFTLSYRLFYLCIANHITVLLRANS